MSNHLSPSSPKFWGVLAEAEGWRLVAMPRGGFALQAAAGDAWEIVEAFPSAHWLQAHVPGVYDVPAALVGAALTVPDALPGAGPARRAFIARFREKFTARADARRKPARRGAQRAKGGR